MKFVKQKAEIIEKSENKINNIANIARICYKSENKADANNESNKRLIENLIKNKHFAMLEHEDLIVDFENDFIFNQFIDEIVDIQKRFGKHLYFSKTSNKVNNIISGNLRAWRDFWKYTFLAFNEDKMQGNKIFILLYDYFLDNIFFGDIFNKYSKGYILLKNDNMGIKQISKDDLTYEREFMAHYRISAKIICDRGISHELVRHRVFSFAQESTRYVNYGKKEIEFIDYSDFKDKFNDEHSYNYFILYNHHNSRYTTNTYKDMINHNIQPQFARNELPHNLKTELIMTGNLYAWLHFFNLRLFEKTGKAHPFIKNIAEQLYEEFEIKTPFSKKLINEYCEKLWGYENE